MAKLDDPQLYSSGYERNRLDRYWTNPWMTKALMRELAAVRYTIPNPVWECAAGRGDMSRALSECGSDVYSSDTDMSEFDNEIGSGHECNFLDEFQVPEMHVFEDGIGASKGVRSIITNPPYNTPRGVADKFIRHGLDFFDGEIEFMAMLLRSEFRSGKSRRDIFGECPHYMGELVLTTRPRWDYGDPDAPEKAAPRHNFSWFLWSKDWRLDGTGRDQKYRRGWAPIQIFSYMSKGFTP